MFSQDDDSQQGFILAFVLGVVALVVAAVIGVGIYQRGKAAKPATGAVVAAAAVDPAAAPMAAPAPAAAAQAAQDAASVKVENGVVKFYFASGKSDLATGANAAMVDVVKGDRKSVV